MPRVPDFRKFSLPNLLFGDEHVRVLKVKYVIVSQSNVNQISYMTPLWIWHYYGLGLIRNIGFSGIMSLDTQNFKILLLFQLSKL